jgi:hypothetical protein
MALQSIPEVPLSSDQARYLFDTAIRNALMGLLQTSVIPPAQVTNLQVTPGPGSNLVQFTRSDGDSFTLYWNTSASLNGATRVDLGTANRYSDNIGIAAVKRYYWVVSRLSGLESTPAGPVAGTTLALNAPLVPVAASPAAAIQAPSNETNENVPVQPTTGGVQPY